MKSIDDNEYESFCKNKLCQGLSTSELKALYEITRPIPFEAGSLLISEGQKENDLFFIIKVTLEMIKKDSESENTYIIDTVNAGEGIGEISFIDRGTRSASVRAKTKSLVRTVSFDALEMHMAHSAKYSHIFVLLLKNISQRLRTANNTTLNALRKEVRENKTRLQFGNFLIYMIVLMCLYGFTIKPMKSLFRYVSDTAYVTLPFTLAVVISLLFMIKKSKISWDQFGISLDNWKQAIFDGIVLSIPFLVLGIILKWLLTQFHPNYIGHPLVEPFATLIDPSMHNWSSWFKVLAVYWLLVVPIQEMIARGALQGLFEHFLIGKHKVLISIFLSNLVFSASHLFFSTFVSVLVLLGGLYIGWIYSRTHNLISSCLSHGILGTWLLFLMGVSISMEGI